MKADELREELSKLKRVLEKHLERKDKPGVITTPACPRVYDAIEDLLEVLDRKSWSVDEAEVELNKLADAKKAVSEYNPKRELDEGETYHPKNLEYIWAMFDLNVAISNFYRLFSKLRNVDIECKDVYTV